MTTIAFDGRYIASDTQITADYFKTLARKMKIVKKYYIWFAGECDYEETYTNMIIGVKGKYKSSELSTSEAIVLTPKGKLLHWSSLNSDELVRPIAIGSGRDFAVMAMHLGKNAEEAVGLASVFDANTNSVIDVFDTQLKKKTKDPQFIDA